MAKRAVRVHVAEPEVPYFSRPRFVADASVLAKLAAAARAYLAAYSAPVMLMNTPR